MNFNSETLQRKLAQFDHSLSLDKASMIPAEWYTDVDVFRAECAKVFLNSWQWVARTDQLREPGQFVTADIAGEPIVVARDKENQLQAFTNVCRHKAARVVSEPCGKSSFFQCRYHGWTYDLKGNLKGTPEFDGVNNFKKEDTGLAHWEVATFGPFVFVHRGLPSEPLDKFLIPLSERSDIEMMKRLKFVERTRYDLNCNWKVFVDNYLDGGYHVNTVHPALSGVLDYSKYKIDVFEKSSLQYSPLVTDPNAPQVSSVRRGKEAQYWWLFPNLMINIYDGVMDTNLVLPTAPNRCTVYFDYYFAETESSEAKGFIKRSIEVAHQVQLEDLTICQEVQKGLESTSYIPGRFSVRRESAEYAFHQLLAKSLRTSC